MRNSGIPQRTTEDISEVQESLDASWKETRKKFLENPFKESWKNPEGKCLGVTVQIPEGISVKFLEKSPKEPLKE